MTNLEQRNRDLTSRLRRVIRAANERIADEVRGLIKSAAIEAENRRLKQDLAAALAGGPAPLPQPHKAERIGRAILAEYEWLDRTHRHGFAVDFDDCGSCQRLAVLKSWIEREDQNGEMGVGEAPPAQKSVGGE